MGKLFYITLNTKGAEENSVMKNVISKKKSTQRKKLKCLTLYVKGSLLGMEL